MASLLLFPSAVKLAHVFANHQHTYCNHYSESHFHQKNLDCQLSSFHQAPFSFPGFINYKVYEPEIQNSGFDHIYFFLSEYQKLPFSLRGPPTHA